MPTPRPRRCAISAIYLGDISLQHLGDISRRHLGGISAIYLGAISAIYLGAISAVSRLYLGCISQDEEEQGDAAAASTVSTWRTVFLTNEWVQLQTARAVSLEVRAVSQS